MLPDATPMISVVIPHLNQQEALAACLRSLAAQTYPRERFEVIVVDNGSDRGISELVACFPDVRFIEERARGAAHARNAGVAAASGNVIAFTDSDCTADSHWLEAGSDAMQNADLAGGAVRVTARNPARLTPEEAFEMIFAFNQPRYIKFENFSVTANLFTKKKLFKDIGGFRGGLPEDKDWCRRAVASGHNIIFVEDAIVFHTARDNWCSLRLKWRRLVEERHREMKSKQWFLARWCVSSLIVFFSIIPHAFRVMTSDDLPDLRSRLMAMGVLCKIRLWRTALMLKLCTKKSDMLSGPSKL